MREGITVLGSGETGHNITTGRHIRVISDIRQLFGSGRLHIRFSEFLWPWPAFKYTSADESVVAVRGLFSRRTFLDIGSAVSPAVHTVARAYANQAARQRRPTRPVTNIWVNPSALHMNTRYDTTIPKVTAETEVLETPARAGALLRAPTQSRALRLLANRSLPGDAAPVFGAQPNQYGRLLSVLMSAEHPDLTPLMAAQTVQHGLATID